MFLNDQELEQLTGYRRKAWQIRWLRNRRFRFELDALGQPQVLRAYVEKRMSDGNKSEVAQPNWAAMAKIVKR
jgi:hypothetical protein